MLFANWFGDGLINILILTALAGWVYWKWFPKGFADSRPDHRHYGRLFILMAIKPDDDDGEIK